MVTHDDRYQMDRTSSRRLYHLTTLCPFYRIQPKEYVVLMVVVFFVFCFWEDLGVSGVYLWGVFCCFFWTGGVFFLFFFIIIILFYFLIIFLCCRK